MRGKSVLVEDEYEEENVYNQYWMWFQRVIDELGGMDM